MVLATAISPLIAVQVTRYLDDRNEERGRKLKVFKTLMATRAYSISPPHVEALNSIDLEFSAQHPKERAVLDIWQQYLDHQGNTGMEAGAWNVRRVDLLVDLLTQWGKCLATTSTRLKSRMELTHPWPMATSKNNRVACASWRWSSWKAVGPCPCAWLTFQIKMNHRTLEANPSIKRTAARSCRTLNGLLC